MMTDSRLTGLNRWLVTLAIGLIALFAGQASPLASSSVRTATTSAAGSTYTYDAAPNRYVVTLANGFDVAATEMPTRASIAATAGDVLAASAGLIAAETADEAIPGIAKGWAQGTADYGKGTVWQKPGATGNANSIRVMDPNDQYSNGHVRFCNEHGQPIGLDGKPGPNSVTHIPRGAHGSYPLPKGWGQ